MTTSHVFSLEALQAQVAAEAAEPSAAAPPAAPPAATPPQPPAASTAASTAAPATTPVQGAAAAADDGAGGYVDLDAWRIGGPESPPSNAAAADGFETRYRVLKGKYDAEVPRLQARIRELEATTSPQDAGLTRQLQTQIETLRREVETLRSAPPASASTNTAPGGSSTSHDATGADDDLVFEYGETGARLIRDLRQQVSTLQQQTDARIGSIEARDATRARDEFRGQLRKRLGEDSAVFDEPGWADFVQQRNPYAAGKSYNTSLIEADAAGDTDTILNIVKAYRQGATAPAPQRRDPFESLAVPDRVQATGAPVAGHRFRAGDLDAMVKKWQRGEKSFAELQSFERAFTAAQQSGRVDP